MPSLAVVDTNLLVSDLLNPDRAPALVAQCPVITGIPKHFPSRLGAEVMTVREWVDQQHQHTR